MRLVTFELRALVWILLSWVSLMLAALATRYGFAPLIVLGLARRLVRWRRRRTLEALA